MGGDMFCRCRRNMAGFARWHCGIGEVHYSSSMLDLVIAYWPHILAALSILMGSVAAVHATMTKEEVRSALGWVGVIVLSPIVGAVIYAIAGINRIRRSTITQQRSFMQDEIMDRVAQFDATGQFGFGPTHPFGHNADLSLIDGQHGDDAIPFLVVRAGQDDSLRHDRFHDTASVATSYTMSTSLSRLVWGLYR